MAGTPVTYCPSRFWAEKNPLPMPTAPTQANVTELSRKIHPTYKKYSEAYPCIIGLGTSGLCDVFLSANKYCRCQQCSKYGTINASVDGAIHFCGLLMRSPIGAPICSLAKWNSQVGGTPMRGGEKLLINYLPACICCATKYVRHVI